MPRPFDKVSLTWTSLDCFRPPMAGALAMLCWVVPDFVRAQPSGQPESFAEEEITLQEEDLDLDEVVVTGSRTARPISEAPVATEVITRKEIESTGARNVADLLELHQGLNVTRTFAGAGLQLEGLSPDYTLILIDGQRITGRVGGTNDLSRLPVEDIERIEIVRGAGSALYGSDAIGGVVNIITKSADEKAQVSLLGGYGTRSRADVTGFLGTKQRRYNGRISGGYHQGDPYDLDLDDLTTNGSGFRQFNVGAQSGFEASDRFTLSVNGEYTYRDLQGIDESATGAVFDRQSRTETVNVRLRSDISFEKAAELTMWTGYSQFRDQFRQDQRGSEALDRYEDTREQLAQGGGQFDILVRNRHLLSSGFEGFYERLDTPRLEQNQDRIRGAIYVQDEWTVVDKPYFVVVPGARLDVDSQFGVYPTPRIAMRLDPHEMVVLRASYGLGFRAPDFRELYLNFENAGVGYVVVGNPDLRPERSRSARAGIEVSPTKWIWASLYGFRNDLSNMIITALSDDPQAGSFDRFQYQNIASAYTQGIELHVRFKPLAGFAIDLGYLLLDTRDRENDRRLEGRATHRGTTAIRYSNQKARFDATMRVAAESARPFYEDTTGDGVDETRRAAPYALVDARISQGVSKHVRVYVLGENLLNAGDPEFLPIPPLEVIAGVEMSY